MHKRYDPLLTSDVIKEKLNGILKNKIQKNEIHVLQRRVFKFDSNWLSCVSFLGKTK